MRIFTVALDKQFTPAALKLWNKIPSRKMDTILMNVRCGHCKRSTTIIDYTDAVRKGDLVLTGVCQTSGSIVIRLVKCRFFQKSAVISDNIQIEIFHLICFSCWRP